MSTGPKEQGLEHVHYEMTRLAECYERWQALRPGHCTHLQVNDLIELTLLHARAVLDFFEYSRVHTKVRGKKAFTDDIVSEDYDWPAKELPIERKIKTRIDKEVAHLSYYRCGLSTEQKRWRPELFVPVLLQESSAFLKHLDKKRPNQSPEPTAPSGRGSS